MNNEKQHSEYKIIETVATPTFDGVFVETHPEKIEMPAEKLADGYYKIPIEIVWGTQLYAAILKENDIVLLNAKSNNTYEEIAGYNDSGNKIGDLDKYDVVTNVLNKYDNIKQINLVIAPSEIKDFENYQTLE